MDMDHEDYIEKIISERKIKELFIQLKESRNSDERLIKLGKINKIMINLKEQGIEYNKGVYEFVSKNLDIMQQKKSEQIEFMLKELNNSKDLQSQKVLLKQLVIKFNSLKSAGTRYNKDEYEYVIKELKKVENKIAEEKYRNDEEYQEWEDYKKEEQEDDEMEL